MANLKHGTTIDGGLIGTSGTATAGATTVAINLSTGNFFEISMDSISSTVIVMPISDIPASPAISTFRLRITQSSPAKQFSWVSGSLQSIFKWPGGAAAAPTLTGANDAVDIYSFTTWDTGNTWYGRVVGHDFK